MKHSFTHSLYPLLGCERDDECGAIMTTIEANESQDSDEKRQTTQKNMSALLAQTKNSFGRFMPIQPIQFIYSMHYNFPYSMRTVDLTLDDFDAKSPFTLHF